MEVAVLFIFIAAVDLCTATILFLVYYLNHPSCMNKKDFHELQEVVLVLLISSLLIVLVNFIYFFYHVIRLAALFTKKNTKQQRCLQIAYRLIMIAIATFQAVFATTFASLFSKLYFCEIKGMDVRFICQIDSQVAFGSFGYRLMIYFLVAYLLCLPRSLAKFLYMIC